jgi:hypothetical protein
MFNHSPAPTGTGPASRRLRRRLEAFSRHNHWRAPVVFIIRSAAGTPNCARGQLRKARSALAVFLRVRSVVQH